MIIQNGYIQLIYSDVPVRGKDEYDYLQQPEETLGPEIPCQYITAGMNRLSRSGTEPVTSSGYTILVEDTPEFLTLGSSLILSSLRGDEIGRFAIRSEEVLEAVGQIRITV